MKKLIFILFIGISYYVVANNHALMEEIDQPLGEISDSISFAKIDPKIRKKFYGADSVYWKLHFFNYSDTLFTMRNQHIDMDSSVWIVAFEASMPDLNYYLVTYNNHKYLVPKCVKNNIVTSANKTLHISYSLVLNYTLMSK